MNLPPFVTQRKWLPTSSAAVPTVIRSLTHSHVCCCCCYCSIRIQIPFYQFYLSLLQAEELRLRTRALSHDALSHTRALLCMLSLIFVCLSLQPVTAFGTLPQPSALCSAVHALSHWRSFHLPASSRQAHSHTAFGLPSLSLCRCLRRVRHRLRGHRCWRRRHRQSFTNFQCERARHLFTVYSARFVRCCCCVCVCRIKCVVLEVCACVYVYLPHLLTTPPPPVPPRQIRPRRSRRLL